MLPGNAKIGRWQPVSGGRHAFEGEARCAEPGVTVRALCGLEVSSDEVQSVADEMAWIRGGTCMSCWRILAARTR